MFAKKNIVWFDEVEKDDVGLVGGKGANLGEMTNAKIPVPYGFIVTSHAYFEFIRENELQPKIKQLLALLNYENPSELQQASSHIQHLIMTSPMSNSLSKQIISYYENIVLREEKFYKTHSVLRTMMHSLKRLYRQPIVAVRSSATAEDLPSASFAGQQDTYLNVRGDSHLLHSIKKCWASLFNERAIYYRHEQKFDHFKVGLAAVVQRMIESDKSGIAFSADPVTNDKTKMVIEAIFGLGEYIVGGKVTPDHYEVDKRSFVILKKFNSYQNIKLVKSATSNQEIRLNKAQGAAPKLTEEEIIKVALLVKEIEDHYYFPQDIEWAIEKNKVFIVQSRPITTLGNKYKDSPLDLSQGQRPILTGSPASPGIGVGPVVIIHSPKEIDKVKHGDVLVAPQTNPDYVPAMKKAVAIVTEKGGRTSHAAIVSRELGIPAVVGTETATKVLKNGMLVSVDGRAGEIYKGNVLTKSKIKEDNSKLHDATLSTPKIKTKTHVYVNLAEPEEAKKVSKMDVDGVGLLRAEFMIAALGTHPKVFIKEHKEHVFINHMAKNLFEFVYHFNPRPIIYRATDFKTNEYRYLKGGKLYEPHEENPMLGFRGASRYIADPKVFLMELAAIKSIWEKGYKNLHLMIPFIRVPWELIKIKEIISNFGLFDFPEFKLYIMVEVPSAALYLEEFIKIGINGVSIGSNDLTMMLLGIDRDNSEVANIYDERNPVVVNVLKHVVATASSHGVTASICGQAPSDYPELVETLVKEGITSLSVNPDAVSGVRKTVHEVEKKLMLNH